MVAIATAFGYDNDLFEKLYTKYESDDSINKIVIPAVDVMNLLLQERLENGRIYIQNIDNALDKINNIQGKSFLFQQNTKRHLGFIAQEIQSILPEIVWYTLNNHVTKQII